MYALNKIELAYFLGLCIGRGCYRDSKMVICFKYKKDNLPTGSISLAGKGREYQADGIKLTEWLRNYLGTDASLTRDDKQVCLEVKIPEGSLLSQTLGESLGLEHKLESFSYKTSSIPRAIWNATIDIQKYFIRGVADSCSSPTRGDRDQNGRPRICIDIPFENWKLPIHICRLLQEKLNVPVHNILWGHPNLRTPGQPKSRSWTKEHRIRFFATDFKKIGFYFEFKNIILEGFSKRDQSERSSFCWPNRKSKSQSRKEHPDEVSDKLPVEIRGKHICNFREICSLMGCKQREK